MNFALATVSLTLAFASQAQARSNNMRASTIGGGQRGLEEEQEFDAAAELPLSLSMPNNEEPLVAAELGESTKYTFAEQQLGKDRFDKTPIGVAIAYWQNNNSGAFSSSAAAAPAAASSKAAGSKSAKLGFCDKRLDEVIDALLLAFPVPGVPVPSSIITAACSFGGNYDVNSNDDFNLDDYFFERGFYPNFGCPVVAFPDNTPHNGGYFLEEVFEYADFFAGSPYGYAVMKFNEYCECHQGYDLGCASKIPYPEYGPYASYDDAPIGDTSQVAGPYIPGHMVYPGDNPKKWEEYCKFVAIWNADVSNSNEESQALFDGLTKEVKECGCFFIASAEGMVSECPGVNLFDYYLD